MSAVEPSAPDVVRAILAHRCDEPGALLPILHDIQDALGFVPAAAVQEIAEALNLSRAEVHGVVGYYRHFRSAPAGRRVLQFCRAEACQANGADELLAEAERLFACRLHATRGDGAVSFEPVYCLGLCAQSPAVTVDGRAHARMTAAKLARLVALDESAA
jgi:formate dehydrogenase subunit gamma